MIEQVEGLSDQCVKNLLEKVCLEVRFEGRTGGDVVYVFNFQA